MHTIYTCHFEQCHAMIIFLYGLMNETARIFKTLNVLICSTWNLNLNVILNGVIPNHCFKSDGWTCTEMWSKLESKITS
jgi:hypothetical protein